MNPTVQLKVLCKLWWTSKKVNKKTKSLYHAETLTL